MTAFTSADRDDWLATKITVAKETYNSDIQIKTQK